METVFLKIMNMSITASWLVLAVLVMRLLLKKAPRFLSVIMWALVGLRLMLPFSFESVFSLIPSTETVPPEILYEQAPQVQTGIEAFNSAINPVISEALAPAPGVSVNPLQVITWLAGWVWIIGMAAMVIYSLISCLRIRRKLREAAPLQDNIWLCDRIDTPFIFGLFRPRIYLPSNMVAQDIPYVLAHEQAHLKRKDHLWKPLGFLLLTIHWFNPLLWLAYILLCRDIEAACDEKVLKDMGEESKKPYSTALVNCSVPRKMIAACPLAFGEVNVKSRIKKVLHYKKPAFWLLITAVVACIVLSVCFLTNPRTVNAKMQVFLDCQIAEHHQSEKSEGHACCLDYQILGTKKSGKTTTVYMWVLYEEYSYEYGQLQQETGFHTPTVITATKEDGNYRLVEYFTPRDGAYNPGDIKAKFPWYLWGKALDSQRYIDRQQKACREMAEQYFKENPPDLSMDTTLPPSEAYVTPSELRERYPQYFDLPTGKGLEVCMWYEDGNVYCGLLAGRNWGYTTEDYEALEGVGMAQMRKIVASYGITRDMISIHPVQIHDYQDWWYADERFFPEMEQLFWSGFSAENVPVSGFDDWGLRMQVQYHFDRKVSILYLHDASYATVSGELMTGYVFDIYALHEGEYIPYKEYVEDVLQQPYPDDHLTWPDAFKEIDWDAGYIQTDDYAVVTDTIPPGTYELRQSVLLQTDDGQALWRTYCAQFEIVAIEDGASALQTKYPQYFGLPTDEGLAVCVWQMAHGNYHWGLLPGKDAEHTWSDYWDLEPASLEDICAIVESYKLSSDQISVCPIHMPYSSYYYVIDDAYQATVSALFWSGVKIDAPPQSSGNRIYDYVTSHETYIELCYQGNRLNPLIIDHPADCAYLMEEILSAQTNGKQGESTKGYYGALYSMDIYWNSSGEPFRFTLWDENTYSTSAHTDSEGYQYFYHTNLAKLSVYLEKNYPVETWYPSPGGTSVREAFDVTVSYAGGANSGALYSDALNRDKMAISSVRHLPIYKIDTRDELDLFVGNYIGVSNSAVLNEDWDEVPYFTATLSQYNDAFFAENTLMLVYVSCSNCTHRFDVDSIYRDSQTLYISAKETTGAEVVDDAEADWFIAVAVPDSMVETCKQFDAELGNFRNL